MNKHIMSGRRIGLFREIDSRGNGAAISIGCLTDYGDNEVGCKYQCARALVVPGQIYVHDIEGNSEALANGYLWIVNAITRKNWDSEVTEDWLVESVVWTFKWAKRHGVKDIHYHRPNDDHSVATDDLRRIFDEVMKANSTWEVELTCSDAWNTSSDINRRRGFGRIRGD